MRCGHSSFEITKRPGRSVGPLVRTVGTAGQHVGITDKIINSDTMNDPKLYTAGSFLQARDAQQILKEHGSKLRWGKAEQILDIGCGPGTVTTTILLPFLPSDASLTACDISEKMVEFAKDRYGDGRVNFRQMDISDDNIWREWQKEAFDKVFSFYCLNWVHNQMQAAQNVYNLLKDDGWAFVTITGYAQPFASFEKLAQLPQWKKYMTNYKRFISPYHYSEKPAEECAENLKSAGFEIITCINRSTSYEFSSMDSLLDLMKPLTVISNQIPADLHEQYFEDMKRVMIEHNLVESAGDTRVVIRYNVLVAVVHKPKMK